jgi:hypothetical protein
MTRWASLTGVACILGLLARGAVAEEVVADLPLPEGVRPFTTAIELAYGSTNRFTFVFRSDIEVRSGQRVIAEGWVMDGTMRREADVVTWAYRLSNIGRDGVERERGSLRVTTGPWGDVRQARVVEDRWVRPGRTAAAADALFNEQNLAFPLCCCPHGPIRMGDELHMPAGTMTMPPAELPGAPPPPEAGEMDLRFQGRSTAVGLLDVDGRHHLVVRQQAESRTATFEPDGFVMRRSGYTLLDTRDCMPRRSVWRSRYEMIGGESGGRVMTMWQSQTLR